MTDESTSAALRRVEAERDELRDTLALRTGQLAVARLHGEHSRAEAERLEALVIQRTEERDHARRWLNHWGEQNDLARAELATARQELDQRRSWVVARDGGRDCGACGQEIRRGEAYEFAGPDDLRHIHCPDRKELDGPRPLPLSVGRVQSYCGRLERPHIGHVWTSQPGFWCPGDEVPGRPEPRLNEGATHG